MHKLSIICYCWNYLYYWPNWVIRILPYKDCPHEVQAQTLEHLQNEFREEMGANSDDPEYIKLVLRMLRIMIRHCLQLITKKSMIKSSQNLKRAFGNGCLECVDNVCQLVRANFNSVSSSLDIYIYPRLFYVVLCLHVGMTPDATQCLWMCDNAYLMCPWLSCISHWMWVVPSIYVTQHSTLMLGRYYVKPLLYGGDARPQHGLLLVHIANMIV